MLPDPSLLSDYIRRALAEDQGDGDHTSLSTIPEQAAGRARLLIKEAGIVAGVAVAAEIFRQTDPGLSVQVAIPDGAQVIPGDVVLRVSGNTRSILLAERLVLNTMQRMSGIATVTHRIVSRLSGTGTRVLDTRKTTPNLRFLEKLAVKIGGGVNHRIGLYDMILIKDNHVDYAGGIVPAIMAARQYLRQTGRSLQIEIEVRNLDELDEVIASGGADRILLDNFSPAGLAEAVARVGGRFVTEASGGITEANVSEYAAAGVDFVSLGALTHSVKSLDMSLKAVQE